MDYMNGSKYDRPKKVILSLCDYSGVWSRPFIDAGYLVVRIDPKHGQIDQGGLGYTTGAAGDGTVKWMVDGGIGIGLTAGALANHLADDSGYYLDNLLNRFYSRDGFDCCEVAGVLIAAPCTDFANSGARWFKDKDADGRTAASVSIVRDCLDVVRLSQTDWWTLENPNGRIRRCVPELGKWLLSFDPCDYAEFADYPDRESYTKKTMLYGNFCPDLKLGRREPVWYYRKRKDGTQLRGSWMWANLGGKSERTKELRSVTPTGFARAFAQAQITAQLEKVGRL